MKINAVYFKKKTSSNFNIDLLAVCIILFLAVLTGTALTFLTEISAEIKNLFVIHIRECQSNSFIKSFLIFESTQILFVFITFISGASMYGKIPILYISFCKICGISAVISFLIKNYMLKGLEYSLLVFFPGKIISIFTIILTAINCIKSSDIINGKNVSAEFSSEIYIKQMMVSCILLTISALTDTFLLKLFMPLFDFV